VKGRQKPVGVPSEEEAYQLGLDYLQKLGVDRSQLVTVGESNKLKTIKIVGGRSWFDKTLGTNVEVNYMRGVDFIRRVNGIDLTQGGADFEFGNNGKITRLEVLWKGLEPYELHSTRTSDQLIKELRSGKGKWTPITPRSIKKVTIYDARPLYRGFPVREDDEHKFLEPFVRLETHVDTGSTNIAAGFDCPIIDETKL
jgi:hypothetical protein